MQAKTLSKGWVLGWVVFGIVNAVITAPGTWWIRIGAIATTLLALLLPDRNIGLFVLVWLVWPPAFMVAAYLGRSAQRSSGDPEPAVTASTRARVTLSAVIAAVAVSALAFRWLARQNLQQTAALFVGIPALLAIVVVLRVSPRSAVGVACKAVTVGLLVSLVFLGEGILCIVMSAPLFYAVAIVVGLVMRTSRRHERPRVLYSSILMLTIIPMSLEGVTGFTTIDREEVISVSKIVESPAQAVERSLFDTPRFDRPRPLYLRAGFPIPVSSIIDKTSGNATWVIRFRGGETRLNGMEPSPGDLKLELKETRPGFVRWQAVSDSSHMPHFLDWGESSVQWEAVDARTTRVTWTLRYRRGLDPAWYFGPMERYAVRLAAGYLIDSVATP
jgi:hypothetical protein